MGRPPDRMSERHKLLHELSSLIMVVNADSETIAPHVVAGGREVLESLQEASTRMVIIFQRLRDL